MTALDFDQSLAIVIGINQYGQGIAPLRTAVADAKAIAQILEKEHGYTVQTLLDDQAQLPTLTSVIEESLPNLLSANSRLLLYFAGHGIAQDGDDGPAGYLIPQDATPGDTDSYFPMVTLHDALTALPCRHFLAIFDCCFAGSFRWSSTRDIVFMPEVIHRERFERFQQDPAWQVITSASHDQKAMDVLSLRDDRGSVGKHSPFAATLLQALKGSADTSPPPQNGRPAGNGVITATELYMYLRDLVETSSDRQRQTPEIFSLRNHDKGEYIFLTPDHELNLPPAPPLTLENNPYRGLAAFETSDADLFFGRQRLTENLAHCVKEHPFTVVLGPSGSGKSSLVKAGLIPALPLHASAHELKTASDNTWQTLPVIGPGESPLNALAQVILSLEKGELESLEAEPEGSKHIAPETDGVRLREIEALGAELLQAPQVAIARLLAWQKQHPNRQLLLAIDQLEELLTLCQSPQAQQQFLAVLLLFVQSPQRLGSVVVTLRSDFESQFLQQFVQPCQDLNWGQSQFWVEPMSRGEFREVIEQPAMKRVLYFEPSSLIDRLLDEVTQMPGSLPLLSHTLSELYLRYLERRSDNRALTEQDYGAFGGLSGVLTKRVDRLYDGLIKADEHYNNTVRNVMLRMVTVDVGDLGKGQRVLANELVYVDPSENQRVETMLNAFVDARLLVKGQTLTAQSYTGQSHTAQSHTAQPCIEPAHDALVKDWSQLQRWRQSELENTTLQRLLTPAVTAWTNHPSAKSAKGYLWNNNPRLSLLAENLEVPQGWLNQSEHTFVSQSLKLKRDNSRRLFSFLGAVILGLSLLTAFAFSQRSEARRQEAEAQKQSSLVLTRASEASYLKNQRLESLLFAVKAMKQFREANLESTDISYEALVALRRAVDVRKEYNRLASEYFRGISSLHFSPVGKTLATVDGGGTVNIWSEDGKEIQSFDTEHYGKGDGCISMPADGFSYSLDGQSILTAGHSGRIKRWDLAGNLLKSFETGHRSDHFCADIVSVDFNWSQQVIATAGTVGPVKLWDLEGELLTTIGDEQAPISALHFSPDGKTLVTAGSQGITLWTLAGQEITSFNTGNRQIETIRFSPDSTTIAAGDSNGALELWTLAGQSLASFPVSDASVRLMQFTPDSKVVATGDEKGEITLWSLAGDRLKTLAGHNNGLASFSFSPDGKRFASAESKGAVPDVKLWRVNDFVQRQLKGHENGVNGLRFSADGKRLITGDGEGMIRVWPIDGPAVLQEFSSAMSKIYDVALSPNGRYLAASGYASNDVANPFRVKLWRWEGGDATDVTALGETELEETDLEETALNLAELTTTEQEDLAHRVDFSADSQYLMAAGREGRVTRWGLNEASPRPLLSLENCETDTTILGANGRLWASACRGDDSRDVVKVWTVDGEPILTLDVSEQRVGADFTHAIASIGLSEDGQTVATAGWDGTVKLWDLEGRNNVATLPGESSAVNGISFGLNDQIVATGLESGEVKLWTRQGKFLETLTGHEQQVTKVVFSPDGKTLATAGWDDYVLLWDFDLDTLLMWGCRHLQDYLQHNPNVSDEDRLLCEDLV